MHGLRTRMLIATLLALAAFALASPVAAGTALAGKMVGISPGHGLEWSGSAWVWERPQTCAPLTCEDLHNIDLAGYLQAYLAQDGAVVKAYRCLDKNYGACPLTGMPWWEMGSGYWLQNQGYPESVYASDYTHVDGHDTVLGSGVSEYWDNVDSRALASNYDNTDILVGLHTNAFDGTINGTESYYEGNDPIHQNWWAASQALATDIRLSVIDSIRQKYGDVMWADRGTKDGDYHETKIANRPTALLELAFHDNCSRDALYLQDDFFKSTTMWAVYKGICDYFGVVPTYDYYSCDLVSSDIPAKLVAGQTYTAHIAMRNHGVLWSSGRGFGLASLVTPDPFGAQSVQTFAGEVGPNETVTFTFDLTAPTALGPYQTGWMMERGGTTWFGPAIQQVVQVVDASADDDPPTIPTSLAADPVSFDRINLTWTASTDNYSVAGYKIYRNGAFLGSSIGPAFADTGLLASTTYSYQVSAYDGSGNESPKCDAVAVTTLADGTPPAAPTNVNAAGTSISRIRVTWDPAWDNTSVASYNVFRNGNLVGSTAGTSFEDSGLAPGTNYGYRVTALDAAGNESGLSASAIGRTIGLGEKLLWSDDMEGYTSQANFQAAWLPVPGYGVTNWSTSQSFSPAHAAEDTEVGLIARYDLPSPQISVGTFYEFKFYDPSGAANAKHWATVRNYSGGGHTGTLSEMLVAGCYYNQSGISTSSYNGRTSFAVTDNLGWFDLNTPRTPGWHTMRIDVTADTTNAVRPGKGLAAWSVDGEVKVDNVPVNWANWTAVTVGSANASAAGTGNYYYDDVKYGVQGGVQRTSGPDAIPAAPNAVVITWKTDVASTSRVDYGLTASYGQSVSDSALVTTHSMALSGLAPASVYHFKVTSTAAGKTASVSEDFTLSTSATSLAQLKALPDGSVSGASDLVVSAIFQNCLYVQDQNRICGTKIEGAQNVEVGGLVNVSGTLATVQGERVLQDAIVTPVGTGSAPKPLGANNKAVGASAGASNSCLLVTTWGKVVELGAGVFWIDDGSGRAAADGKTGIKVMAGGPIMPSINDSVSVTGISGSESIGGVIYPVVRPRGDADVVKAVQ